MPQKDSVVYSSCSTASSSLSSKLHWVCIKRGSSSCSSLLALRFKIPPGPSLECAVTCLVLFVVCLLWEGGGGNRSGGDV